MAEFENLARQAILRVAESKTFAEEDRNYILNFIALLAVRSPEMRENMRENQERLLKMVTKVSMSNRQYFDVTLEKMRAEGVAVGDDFTYERMKDFADRGDYTIRVPRERHIVSEFKLVEPVLKYLDMRKWRLYVLRDGEGSFVTTDHPVSLTWFEPDKVPPHAIQPRARDEEH